VLSITRGHAFDSFDDVVKHIGFIEDASNQKLFLALLSAAGAFLSPKFRTPKYKEVPNNSIFNIRHLF